MRVETHHSTTITTNTGHHTYRAVMFASVLWLVVENHTKADVWLTKCLWLQRTSTGDDLHPLHSEEVVL